MSTHTTLPKKQWLCIQLQFHGGWILLPCPMALLLIQSYIIGNEFRVHRICVKRMIVQSVSGAGRVICLSNFKLSFYYLPHFSVTVLVRSNAKVHIKTYVHFKSKSSTTMCPARSFIALHWPWEAGVRVWCQAAWSTVERRCSCTRMAPCHCCTTWLGHPLSACQLGRLCVHISASQ